MRAKGDRGLLPVNDAVPPASVSVVWSMCGMMIQSTAYPVPEVSLPSDKFTTMLDPWVGSIVRVAKPLTRTLQFPSLHSVTLCPLAPWYESVATRMKSPALPPPAFVIADD